MKETTENIIQILKNNINHPLFEEQIKIIMRDEYKYRMSLIKKEFNKIKKALNDQIIRCIGSVISFIFSIFWFILILPIRLLKILIMFVKIPFQCKKHNLLQEMVKEHPAFIKMKEDKNL